MERDGGTAADGRIGEGEREERAEDDDGTGDGSGGITQMLILDPLFGWDVSLDDSALAILLANAEAIWRARSVFPEHG